MSEGRERAVWVGTCLRRLLLQSRLKPHLSQKPSRHSGRALSTLLLQTIWSAMADFDFNLQKLIMSSVADATARPAEG